MIESAQWIPEIKLWFVAILLGVRKLEDACRVLERDPVWPTMGRSAREIAQRQRWWDERRRAAERSARAELRFFLRSDSLLPLVCSVLDLPLEMLRERVREIAQGLPGHLRPDLPPWP